MKISRAAIGVAALSLCVGLAGGAVAGVAIYQKAHGDVAEAWAGRAGEYALMLATAPGDVRSADAVVDRVIAHADQATLTAAMGYDGLRAPYRELLDRAVARMQADPRVSAPRGDVVAQYASAARACIVAGSSAQGSVGDCTQHAVEAIKARYCTGAVCEFPGLAPMASR